VLLAPLLEKNALGGVKMEELSAKKINDLNKQPVIKTAVKKSRDGKWVIHKTTIVDIKPMSYFDKVLSGEQ